MSADRLIALSEHLERRDVKHDVRPPYIDVYAHGTRLGTVGYYRGYEWQGNVLHDVEKVALVIALDVTLAELSGGPAR